MSCNGCRALRKRCSEDCILRTSLQWIQTSDAQANATLFLAKFFGRADLMSFIAAVSHHQRPALFQSLLLEACGRIINPVSGVIGLFCSGNIKICKDAVNTVLSGGILHPIPSEFLTRVLASQLPGRSETTPFESDVSEGSFEMGDNGRKLLNLFV